MAPSKPNRRRYGVPGGLNRMLTGQRTGLLAGLRTGLLLTLTLALALALPLVVAGCARPVAAVEFQTLSQGTQSGIQEQTAVLIADPERWKAHWERHAKVFVPAPPPPPVDFDTSSLVAVHLGERRTGGYTVSIAAINREEGHLRVTAVERRPAPGAVVTMALTQPYHIVLIPRVEPGTVLAVTWEVAGER